MTHLEQKLARLGDAPRPSRLQRMLDLVALIEQAGFVVEDSVYNPMTRGDLFVITVAFNGGHWQLMTARQVRDFIAKYAAVPA